MSVPSSSSVDFDKHTISHEERRPLTVLVSGEGNEFITLGDKKYYRHELMTAFAGTLVPERYAPPPVHKFGNAAALGLAAFSLTTFVSGLYISGAMGIKIPAVGLGLVLFHGGFVSAAAGIWELIIGNCFGGTVLTSFGMGFWLSYGAINVRAFGIMQAYALDPEQFNNALGFFMLGWAIFTFMSVMCTLKSTLFFIMLFVTIDMAFILFTAHYFTGNHKLMTAGGVFCVISSCCGWVCVYAGIATPQNSYFTVKPTQVPIFGKKKD